MEQTLTLQTGWRYTIALWLHRVRSNPLLFIGAGLLILLCAAAVFAPWLAPYDPAQMNFAHKLQAPNAAHWFGTDNLGRDIFSRVLYGAQVSLTIGFATVVFSLLIGLPVGLLAGYAGGRVDTVLMRVSDVFLAFPPMLLPICMIAILGPGLFNVMLAIAVSWFPWYARILRAAVLSVRNELYVHSARAIGVSHVTIMFRHLLPNAMTPLLVQVSMDFGYVILWAAALSFLGLGAVPPTIEWGLMIGDAQSLFLEFWWTAVFPGLAIFICVLAVNLLGDGLRDMLDPTFKGRE
ncbi:ABC transporter permease [Photobacterium sp. SP02]|uniref:ABC transporter permease n=1 Tax=Photobacterium TaxID=657 RepID=UPI000EA215A6|nr:ABC transporter permease [Photobacterium salinisoli]